MSQEKMAPPPVRITLARQFSILVTIALLIGNVVLALLIAFLIERFVVFEIEQATSDAVELHFARFFDSSLFAPLAPEDYARARRLVGTHFDLYDIVSADFYGLDGTIGFSYDPSLMGAAAPEAINAVLGENFPRSVSTTMTSLESSDDGAGPPIEAALRLVIPVRDQVTGDPEGLAVVHRDISPQIEAVRRMQLIVGLIIGLILAGAIVLHVSMRRIYQRSTDRVVQQATQLQDANDEIGRTLIRVERNERRFRALVQNASDITAVIDRDGLVTYVSPSSGRALDRSAADLIGSRWIDLVHDEDRLLFEGTIKKLRTTAISEANLEFRLHRSNGEWRHFEAIATDLLDEPAVNGIVINSRDVSDRRRFQAELTRRALNDSLTGLPNRVLFADRLNRALERPNVSTAVILLGLDRFMLINDGFGHAAGDQLLHLAGQRFTSCLDAGDTLARIGGDEFAVLVENPAGEESGDELARRFLDALREPFTLEGREVFVTASGGIAYSAPDRAGADHLLRDAGVALHHAKAQGKHTAVLFDLSMDPYAAEQVGLESDLRRALERDELFLQYQPEVELSTGAIVGVEALIRWQHPKRGLIVPNDFIPIAEDSGLIVEIGRWVIETACAQAGRWMENHPDLTFTMSVNLSPRQFQDPGIFEHVARVLQQTGLPAERLKLEITESTLIENMQSAIVRLDALTAMGIRLAIDDFGTGYSSYGYLRELSIDTLKIDRTFVTPLPDDRRNLEIIRSITVLAHALEMDVTVEGVETAAQREAVMEAGCRRGQGFLFERPVDVEAIDELLMSGRTLLPAELRSAA